MKSLFIFIYLFVPALFAKEGVVALDIKKWHLEVEMASRLPTLKLRSERTNRIRIELNEKGAFVDSRLVCSWPGGL
jgi:hypothetical protein